MTINFHKKTGMPGSVTKGHSDVWFSDLGLYVADNNGKPTVISASTSSGTTTPVGNPGEVNRIYFNKTTRKHYISTEDKWLEIPTAGIPGSGSGAGNASSVMIEDAGNWFTSNDVEGALSEIGERLPHIFGSGVLPVYGGNSYDIKTATEYLLNTTAINKPSSAQAWLISRKSSSGDIYGISVDKNGDLFSRVNNKFTLMARKTELEELIANVGTDIEGVNNNLKNWKVKDLIAGTYTSVSSNNGVYSVTLDSNAKSVIDSIRNGEFVKKTGDSMTGNLTVKGQSGTGVVFVRDKDETNYVGLRAGTDGTGLYDYKQNRSIFANYNSGSTYIRGYGQTVSKFIVEHKIDFESSGTNVGYPFVFRSKNSNSPLLIEGSHSRHLFGGNTGGGISYIDIASATGRAQDLYFGVIGGAKIPLVKFRTNTLHIEGKLTTATGVNIGANSDASDGAGAGNNTGAKIYMFPYRHNGTAAQRRRYAAMGYSATDHTVTFHSAQRHPGMNFSNYSEVKIVAGGYITKSSEEYKDIHGEFEVSVLDDIMKMKPYVYNYKGETKAELGFVLERNVPKILQEGGKELDGKGLSSYSLVTYLWKGVQELAAKVAELEGRAKTN